MFRRNTLINSCLDRLPGHETETLILITIILQYLPISSHNPQDNFQANFLPERRLISPLLNQQSCTSTEWIKRRIGTNNAASTSTSRKKQAKASPFRDDQLPPIHPQTQFYNKRRRRDYHAAFGQTRERAEHLFCESRVRPSFVFSLARPK